jgi:uncharacterized protein YceK
MKKLKIGLMAIVALTGAGSAFAFNHPKAHAGTKYYAVRVSAGINHSRWTATQPDGSCNNASALACTITSTSTGVTSLPQDTYPAQFTKIGTDGESYPAQ